MVFKIDISFLLFRIPVGVGFGLKFVGLWLYEKDPCRFRVVLKFDFIKSDRTRSVQDSTVELVHYSQVSTIQR